MSGDRKTNDAEFRRLTGLTALPGPTALPGGSGSGPTGDEDALRDLLRGAVGGIEPSGDALERLRYAVPARRVRNRRILVAAAAAVVVLGGSVPVGLYLTSGTGANSDRSTMAGHGQAAGNENGGSGLHQNGSSSRPRPKRSSDKEKDKDKDKDKDKEDAENGGASAAPVPPGSVLPSVGGPNTPPRAPSPVPGTTGSVGGGLLPPPASSVVPNCALNQLGVSGSTRAPSADGKIYGSFKVTNVSSRGCTVRGPEALAAGPAYQGGAPVTVVSHVTGDPATGLLPDPSVESLRFVVAPNGQYEVRFAWVPPEGGCPVANGTEGGGTPEEGTAGTPDAGTGTGQVQAEVPPLGAVVAHTPNPDGPDGPTTQLTIPEACGGTVYRTGVIPLR